MTRKEPATLEHQFGIVRKLMGHRRNRVFAYSAYIALLNQEAEE